MPSSLQRAGIGPRADLYLSLSFFFFAAGTLPFLNPEFAREAFQIQRAAFYSLSVLCFVKSFGLTATLQGLRRLPLPAPLVLMMGWALLSYGWSVAPRNTAVRWSETTICMLYGGCFSVLALERYNSFSDIARILTRSFIWVVLFALMGNLFVHGEALHMIVNRWVPDRPRLQFLNAHPLASGDIVALGMICILFKDRLRALDYLALAAFGYLLFLTDSTAARLTLPLIGVAWWLTGTNYRAALMKTGLFLVAAAVLALLFIQFAPSVLNSPAAERYVTLTGRAKFWEALYWSPLVGSFLGTGFDASSVAILELLRKNYHAHNEYLSTLVELGYIGVALHTLLLLTWIFVLLRAKKALPFAILIYMLMVGITNPMLFTKPVPIFFFMLSFLGALHILRPSPVTYEAQPAEVEAGRVQAVSR